MFETIILLVAFLFIVIASYTDFKSREVPDWVNFAAIASGLGLRLLYSVFSWDYHFFVAGVIGFAAAYLLACIMFYSGQWGGGDSKLLMGVGALLGVELSFDTKGFAFLIALIIVGAGYGLLWSVWLAVNNWKGFVREAKSILFEMSALHRLSLGAAIVIFAAAFVARDDVFVFVLLLFLSLFVILFFYLFVFVKAVQDSCLMKWVVPQKLTEGDWVAEDVVVGKRIIAGPKDLGVSQAQIKQLIALYNKRKIRRVLLKTGIPFVPSFLLAFLLMLWKGNVLLAFL